MVKLRTEHWAFEYSIQSVPHWDTFPALSIFLNYLEKMFLYSIRHYTPPPPPLTPISLNWVLKTSWQERSESLNFSLCSGIKSTSLLAPDFQFLPNLNNQQLHETHPHDVASASWVVGSRHVLQYLASFPSKLEKPHWYRTDWRGKLSLPLSLRSLAWDWHLSFLALWWCTQRLSDHIRQTHLAGPRMAQWSDPEGRKNPFQERPQSHTDALPFLSLSLLVQWKKTILQRNEDLF